MEFEFRVKPDGRVDAFVDGKLVGTSTRRFERSLKIVTSPSSAPGETTHKVEVK